MIKLIPNILTISRVFTVPIAIVCYQNGWGILGLMILLVGCLTDFLDGYVARLLNAQSNWGALLDPVADKLFVLYLSYFLLTADLVSGYYVALLWTRNIAQLMAIPVLTWWLRISFMVKPRQLPKWATALSFTTLLAAFAVPVMAGVENLALWLSACIQWLLIPVSVALELYVLVTYLPRFIEIATGKHDTFE